MICNKIISTYFYKSLFLIVDNGLENQGIDSKPVNRLFCDDSFWEEETK